MANPKFSINKTAFNPLSLIIPAGGEVAANITGKFIRCMEADGPFEIAFEEFPKRFPFDLGVELITYEDELFTKIRLFNSGSEAIACEFLYGYGEIKDDRLNVVQRRITSIMQNQDAENEFVTSATVSLANTASIAFSGVPTGTQVRRKALIVTNQDSAGSLEISDGTNVGAIVFKESNFLLEGAGPIEIHNNSGGAITCKFMEVWYVNNL